jgi:hypothetical protein
MTESEAIESEPGRSGELTTQPVRQMLSSYLDGLGPLDERSVNVLELLTSMGTRRRSASAIGAIQDELTARGLEEYPPITVASLDGKVVLRRLPDTGPPEALSDVESPPDELDTSVDVNAHIVQAKALIGSRRLGLYIGNVAPMSRPVISVNIHDEPRVALTKMAMHGDQPVIAFTDKNQRNPAGAVTWQAVVRYQLSHGYGEPEQIKDVLEKVERVFEGDELIPHIPLILSQSFLLVEDSERRVTRTITPSDLTKYFVEKTRAFLLVGDIEGILRDILVQRLHHKWDSVAAIEAEAYGGNRLPSSPDELSFGTYVQSLQRPDMWNDLRWRLDKKEFCQALDEVRIIRNEIMHFSPDSDADNVDRLERFLALLRIVEPEIVSRQASAVNIDG